MLDPSEADLVIHTKITRCQKGYCDYTRTGKRSRHHARPEPRAK